MDKKEIMYQGITLAMETSKLNLGGPFGAVVVKDGEIIAVASNSVLMDNDPTAHAEMNAIRKACKKLNTYDLSGCELYATGYPCPMCLSAIIWSNIKTVYYGCTPQDAAEIGFRDDFIYDYIINLRNNSEDKSILNLTELNREDCLTLFNAYVQNNKTIY